MPTTHMVASTALDSSNKRYCYQSDNCLGSLENTEPMEIAECCADGFAGSFGSQGLSECTASLVYNFSYPETVTLNLGQTLSSGHGSVSFSSDAECSNFVKTFFPQCGAHIQSCHEVAKVYI